MIKFFGMTHMISMVDLLRIGVRILRIDNGCSLEKELTKLMYMNPSMLFYQTVNQVDLYNGFVSDLLIRVTKDIF